MKNLIFTSILIVLLASPVQSAPMDYPNQKEGDFIVHDFRFQNGDVLPELRLHYITLGMPQRNKAGRVTNAVLMLHGTPSTGKSFLAPSLANELFGAGQLLDASRYYIILPDGIGRGGSSKPSDGLRARFPRYGYSDVVMAHQLLVTQGLGVDHLRLILGTSMGGMQTWMWGERYPEMMDALMPIASQPAEISGRNLLWRRLITEAIRTDPDWKGGDYMTPPKRWVTAVPIFTIMVDSAVHLQRQAPTRQDGNALYDKIVATALKNLDANDYLYWFESSWDYNPEPDLGQIKAKLVAVNFADDLTNASDLGVMEKLITKVSNGRFVLVPASSMTSGHVTFYQAVVWKPYLEELLRSLQ